ncbi:GTP-binding protein At3g49725, chloroplastic [Durio zibethinus]|uniref:GTP-binding protein At3g49725, chloroplastic n=1 Tax=Durio zibethinus TaxID=66656 RepID=A0A6P5YKK7_DURZI|nr:GTP-binding protein At3g49725, chloroplastic [Durio zibethinus]
MLRVLSLSRTCLRSRSQSLSHKPSLSSSLFSILSSPYSTSKQQNKGTEDSQNAAVSLFNRDPSDPPRLFVVQPRLRPATFLQAKLNEALCLANSLEEQRDGYFDSDFFDKELPAHVVVQNPSLKSSKIRADTYFGPGTVENIRYHLNALESKGEVDAVFVNTVLSGVQQRNLERILGKPVLDRVGLIIEIFNAHAHTKEAKLQAELAALMYKKSRLVRVRGLDGRNTFGVSGEAEVVSARGRGSGGRGFISGAGETELQLQRRRILERRSHLLSQIEEVRRTRAVQRAARKRQVGFDGQGLATVAVVGYTNAGKSTLVSALSDSDLYSDVRLFATLDARLKSVVLPSGRKVLFSDTVGFISELPVQLVEAFHSTLEEVVEADLLVHVIDCTAPNLDEHRSTVLHVLQQIGVSEEKLQNMIEVWNKIDYEEEMGANEYTDDVEDVEDVEISNISGAEDVETNNSEEEDCNVAYELLDGKSVDNNLDDIADADGSDVFKPSPRDVEETMDDKQGDYSDGWLLSGDDSADNYWNNLSDQQTETSNHLKVEQDSQSQPQHVPHVKVSALTGVGLQELLEIIDERLKVQDDKLKSQEVVESSFFDRKWRPLRKEDEEVAVEQ